MCGLGAGGFGTAARRTPLRENDGCGLDNAGMSQLDGIERVSSGARPGKKVLISPQWIERVSWSESKVFVNIIRETIQQSPKYTEESLLNRDYETGLHQHYNRLGYWVDDPADKEHSR